MQQAPISFQFLPVPQLGQAILVLDLHLTASPSFSILLQRRHGEACTSRREHVKGGVNIPIRCKVSCIYVCFAQGLLSVAGHDWLIRPPGRLGPGLGALLREAFDIIGDFLDCRTDGCVSAPIYLSILARS